MPRLLPKFLTNGLASSIVPQVVDMVMGLKNEKGGPLAKRGDCHIVVLVPSMEGTRYPVQTVSPFLLYEHSRGDRAAWENRFDEIARCKALQRWHDRNDDRTDCMPHLLFPGDTPYWGTVKREGIVVGCSGVQPWLDKTISGMCADLLIGAAYDAFMRSPDKKRDWNFLT